VGVLFSVFFLGWWWEGPGSGVWFLSPPLPWRKVFWGWGFVLITFSLSLSLSAFYFHVFVFALPTAVGNSFVVCLFPVSSSLVLCISLVRVWLTGFFSDARIFVRERVEIISM
jgi:hypothetical protein